MIGADEPACKKLGRPPVIIKEVEDMLTEIRKNNNATDVIVFVSDILKDSSDTHLTKYLSQVQILLSKPSIDISDVSNEIIERVTTLLNETADVNLGKYKELHATAILWRDAHFLEMNNLIDIIKYIEYNIKNLELYEPLNKLKLALIEMIHKRCHKY